MKTRVDEPLSMKPELRRDRFFASRDAPVRFASAAMRNIFAKNSVKTHNNCG